MDNSLSIVHINAQFFSLFRVFMKSLLLWLAHSPIFNALLSHESSGLLFIGQPLPDSAVSQSIGSQRLQPDVSSSYLSQILEIQKHKFLI